MGPRILLIAPTALDSEGRPIKKRRLHLPGLTLPLLAAVTPEGCEVRLVSETVDEIPYGDSWDLVGISSMGSGAVRGWQIADRFRSRGVPVVIGGIGASLGDPELTLAHADTLVVGDAEEVWPRVVEDFMAGRLRSMYHRDRPPPPDAIPEPRYDLLNVDRLGAWRPVQAARGCPFPCRFCSVTAFSEGRYYKRPVDHVIRDVRAAKRHGTRYIAFIDDNIGVDWDYCADLWEALIAEKITWMSQCSLHIADQPVMLRLAHRSGCRLLSFGLESVHRSSLDSVQKGWNHPEHYLEAVHTIRGHGIDVSTEMIVGLDGDDASVFRRTFEFLMAARISVPRVHILTPVPGTPLYQEMRESGRIRCEDFSKYTGGHVVFEPARMSVEELQIGYWKLYARLFSRRSILKRIAGNPARLGPFMRTVVLGTNLTYRQHVQRRITPGIV